MDGADSIVSKSLPGGVGQGDDSDEVGPKPSGYGCCEFHGRREILRFWSKRLVKSPRPVYANGRQLALDCGAAN